MQVLEIGAASDQEHYVGAESLASIRLSQLSGATIAFLGCDVRLPSTSRSVRQSRRP